MPANIELLASDSRGVYIPQYVAECVNLEPQRNTIENFEELMHCLNSLKAGPDDESYWDSWDWIIENACIRYGRARWMLHQDGDCWAIRMNRAGRKEAAKSFGWE